MFILGLILGILIGFFLGAITIYSVVDDVIYSINLKNEEQEQDQDKVFYE